MKNTKIFAATTAAALALAGLTACSNDENNNEDGTATETASVEATEEVTETTTVESDAADASGANQDGAETGEGINQTELDEWAKGVIGLGLTQQFGDAAEDPNAPSVGARLRAVTVENGTLFLTTDLNTEANEGLSDAEALATMFGDALKNNPPAFGEKINKVVVQDQAQTPMTEEEIQR